MYLTDTDYYINFARSEQLGPRRMLAMINLMANQMKVHPLPHQPGPQPGRFRAPSTISTGGLAYSLLAWPSAEA
ncbi:hypothetical protein ACLKA6_009109 [Drosophila palustris]